MNEYEIVRMAKERFDRELHTSRYRKIHADADHLEKLIQLMEIRPQQHYIDLGTGNGYIAFELARRFPEISITGVDIADNAIAQNQQIARESGLEHVTFQTYTGMQLPFADACCHGVVSRYAFHHFPNPMFSAQEIARVLQPGGYFVLSDPVGDDEDTVGFIDRFQQLLPDGHVCFYKRAEIINTFAETGFTAEKQFFSFVTYPRTLHNGYWTLLEQTAQDILDRYHIDIREQEVFITVKIANTRFRKGGCAYVT
jgi:ubiquinone/menaquinone biosynthesis C-methylase UbiE